MSLVAQHVQDVLQNGPKHRFTIVVAPALESHANKLLDEARAYCGRVQSLSQPSQESQQLDQQAQLKMIEDLRDQIQEYIPQEVDTGHVHHFLIDAAAVADGEAGAQATLKAMVSASLKDPKAVVAAVLPLTTDANDDRTIATQHAVVDALECYDIKPFVSAATYVNYLHGL